MSFSGNVKKELSEVAPSCPSCKTAALYGMLLFSRTGNEKLMLVHTERKYVADYCVDLLTDLTGAIITVFIHDYVSSQKRRSFSVCMENKTDFDQLSKQFHFYDHHRQIDMDLIQKDCCFQAFLRGAFMVCGSITDPQKEYHLEFSVVWPELAKNFAQLLKQHGFSVKTASRNKGTVIYLKESEPIEDMLTYMGAVNSSLELMNIKILKDVRNQVNRVTNCETANIGKTVNAAAIQLENIRLIQEKIGIDQLPDDLREVAELRLENPDMSLRELCLELSEPISRSGVNHRLKRLAAIADELRENRYRRQK